MSALLSIFLLQACVRSGHMGGQTGEEMIACGETRAVVTAEDDSAGYSAQDWLARFAQSQAQLVWTAGGETGLDLSLQAGSGEITLVHQEPLEGGEEAWCTDYLIFPVELGFRTEDGSFDEEFSLNLNAWSADSGELAIEQGDDQLAGAWRAEAPSLVLFSVGWNATGSAGQISATDNATGAFTDIAAWSP